MGPKLVYDLGTVENSKYGSAMALSGELPLLSAFEYKLPKINQDRDQVDRVITYLMDKYRYLWPPGTDAKNKSRAALALMFPGYAAPQLDWDEDPGLCAAAEFWMAAFVLDDIADTVLRIVNGKQSYRVVLAFVQNFGKAEVMNFEDFIPGYSSDQTSPMYYFGNALGAMHKAIRNLKNFASQNDVSKFDFFMEELTNAALAHYLIIAAKTSNEDTNFSNEAFSKHVAQHLHAMRLSIGISVLVNPEAKLPNELKDSLLFKMLIDSCGNIMAWCNAIVGMQRDIRKDTWEDTIILRNVLEKNLSLQEAFDLTVAAYKSEVRDANLIFDILEETYGDIDGVDELLESIHNAVNGTCATYIDSYANDRYGITLKYVDSEVIIHKKPKVQVIEDGNIKYDSIISIVENPNVHFCDP